MAEVQKARAIGRCVVSVSAPNGYHSKPALTIELKLSSRRMMARLSMLFATTSLVGPAYSTSFTNDLIGSLRLVGLLSSLFWLIGHLYLSSTNGNLDCS